MIADRLKTNKEFRKEHEKIGTNVDVVQIMLTALIERVLEKPSIHNIHNATEEDLIKQTVEKQAGIGWDNWESG